jgi:hypothetical protein
MKITYYLPSSLDNNKVGPILEQIMLSSKDNDNDISILVCGGGIQTCAINQKANPYICKACKKNTKRLIQGSKILKNVDVFELNDYLHDTIIFENLSNKNTLKSFQNIYWDQNKFDVGWAIVSTFVSSTRDITNKINFKSKNRLIQNYQDSVIAYEATNNFIKLQKPDKIVIFNGRLFETRAVLRSCQQLKIDCDVLEICGYELKNWIIYPNSLPHDLGVYTKKLNELWDKEEKESKKTKIADNFFHLRRSGDRTNDRSHIDIQKDQLLPDNFNRAKKNIIIFNSSEDEIFSIGPDWTKTYETQLDGIKAICEILRAKEEFHVYLRLHPNLRGVESEFLTDLLKIEGLYRNVTVIPPDSPISSYELLDNAYKVVTFGSTIGVEATFWGVPSMTLSDCFYSTIGATYNSAIDNLENFLIDEVVPKSKTLALKYGFYQMNAGTKFENWTHNSSEINSGKFPQPNYLDKALNKMYELFN